MDLLAAFGFKTLTAGVILWALLRLMWDWDDDLLAETAAALEAEMRAGRPSQATAWTAAAQLLNATLGARLPFADKARRVLWTSVASSVAMLALYIMELHEHAAAIAHSFEADNRL